MADQSRAELEAGTPDPILGHIIPGVLSRRASARPPSPISQPWDGCQLQRTLIHPQSVWSLPPPDYAAGDAPKHLQPGLSTSDKEMIFGAVPYVSSALKYNPDASPATREEAMAEVVEEQERQSEMLMRILDLRNASRERINAVNRERVVEAFGQGWDTGSSRTQGEPIALLVGFVSG